MARTSRQALERRISPNKLRKYFDDNNSGSTDNDAVEQLLLDAQSKVDSYLAPLGLLPFTDPIPPEVTRLDLDVAVAYAAQRHPEAVPVNGDWKSLMEQAEKDLCRLREGKTMLGVTPPDPAANHGGAIYNQVSSSSDSSSSSSSSSCETTSFWESTGDF